MKPIYYSLFALVFLFACQSVKQDYLIKFYEGPDDELGTPSGYINSAGDTIVPFGRYGYCYTDTIRNFGIVHKKAQELWGIDEKGKELFQVFFYDNGPDYLAEGLFRIIIDNKIGYANADGEIIISPRFGCAFPFEDGKAKVSDDCSAVKEGEYTRWVSENWYWIDKNGDKL